MHFFTLAIGALALGTSLASPTPRSGHVRHEKRSDKGQLFKRSRAPRSMELPVRIALAQNNLHVGPDRLMDISDPMSPNFGKHMTTKEVGDLFRPSGQTINSVRDWLHESGIQMERHTVTHGKGWLKFYASVEELETLLATEYHVYEHTTTKENHVGCDEYHLPAGMIPHIDFVTPSVSTIPLGDGKEMRNKKRAEFNSSSKAGFPPHMRPAGISPNSIADTEIPCHVAVTPECLRGEFHHMKF
jgi:tripeptidyl-peptidase-1